MSDLDRLRDKLSKLRREGQGLVLDARSRAGFLKALALIVDETVLPREIALTAADRSVALLVVKRRLVGVSGDVTADFSEDGEAAAQVAQLGADIFAAFKGASKIAVRASRADIAPGLQGQGHSADALAEGWGVALYATVRGIAALLPVLQEKGFAWVLWDHGAAKQEGGDTEYLKALKKISQRALRIAHGGDRGLLAAGGMSFATVIGFAWDGENEASFVIARTHLAAVTDAFQGA